MGNACNDCSNDLCLRNVPLFSSLHREAIHTLTSEMEHRRYKKGEVIVHEGEKASAFTVIREGSAKAYRITPDGREQILYIFPVNDYFGARFLFTEEQVPYTVEALEPTTVCILSKTNFANLLAEHSQVAIEIIEAMANRMSRLESAMQSMGGRNADMRIASFLLEFRESYGRFNGPFLEISLPLSREGLANYLGIARETLSRKLTQFEEEGIIESVGNRVIRVLDIDRLSNLSFLVD
ncbi:MAG: Crp/Fnr family transcriptional regulator [Sphaerochaetaceae bacterium]